jgi:hypothetical protein
MALKIRTVQLVKSMQVGQPLVVADTIPNGQQGYEILENADGSIFVRNSNHNGVRKFTAQAVLRIDYDETPAESKKTASA